MSAGATGTPAGSVGADGTEDTHHGSDGGDKVDAGNIIVEGTTLWPHAGQVAPWLGGDSQATSVSLQTGHSAMSVIRISGSPAESESSVAIGWHSLSQALSA